MPKPNYVIQTIIAETDLVLTDPAPLCVLPYPGHPRGCPNFGKRHSCPPASLALTLSQGRYLILAVQFDIAAWARRMKEANPTWSDRQCRCCLYWQGQSRKALGQHVLANRDKYSGGSILCPEARGADITAMMKAIDYPLQWPPVDYVWTVALAKPR